MDSTVNDLQVRKLVRDILSQNRPKSFNRKSIELIVLVYDWFKVSDENETFEDICKLVSGQATVIEQDTIHLPVIYELTCFGYTLTLPFT